MLDHYHDEKLKQEAKEVCAELNEHLMDEFGHKTPPAYVASCNTICAKRKAFDIYLRHKPALKVGWGENILVIARIAFDRQRIGSGSSLLRYL